MTSVARSGAGENPSEPAKRYCPECGTQFKRELVPFTFDGEEFGYFPADVCANGHEYFLPESREQIQKIAKALGFWGPGRAGTGTPVYGQTRDVDLQEWKVISDESPWPTPSTTITITFQSPQVKKKMTIASAAL